MNQSFARLLTVALAGTLSCAAFGVSPRPKDMTIRAYASTDAKKQIVGIIQKVSERKGLECKDVGGIPQNQNARIDLLFECKNQTRRAAVVLSDIYYVTTVTIDGYFDSANPGLIEDVMSEVLANIKGLPEVQLREISYAPR